MSSYASIRRDLAAGTVKPLNMVWHGEIAADVANLSDPATVILPDYDRHIVWGPCRWQSRDDTSLPAKGDICAVLFNNRNEPVIVMWWPFS